MPRFPLNHLLLAALIGVALMTAPARGEGPQPIEAQAYS
jgi:hypothetical protein